MDCLNCNLMALCEHMNNILRKLNETRQNIVLFKIHECPSLMVLPTVTLLIIKAKHTYI